METALEWFVTLPRYVQFVVVVGLVTPLLVLVSYLNPPPPPPRPDGRVVLEDGKKGDVYLHRR
jgi:hypothetical protein